MKKFLALAAGAALSLSLFAGGENASANSEGAIDSLQLNLFKEHVLESIKGEYPNAQFIDVTAEELQKQEEVKFGVRAPAPPLSSLEVYAAISTQHQNYEYFSPNQLSSVYDHGGTELYIVTEELGYGHIRYAKFNGVNLKELQREHIDFNGDTIVDGWYIWWDASGNDSGTFNYQNTSTNFPSNTMSDSIFIK